MGIEIIDGMNADPLHRKIERAREALPSDQLIAQVKLYLIENNSPQENFELIDSIRKVRDILQGVYERD